MQDKLSSNSDKAKKNLLLYGLGGKDATPSEIGNSVGGRLGNALSGAIAYKRDSSLFDTKEITDRDKELRELLSLKESDSYLSIDRKDKPVVLSPLQTRILYALSCVLDVDSEEVKEKIKKPFKRGGGTITRAIDISALSVLMFGNSRFRERKKIIEELCKIARTRQVQILGKGNNRIKVTAPFINIGETIEDLNPEREKGLDFVNVIYGGAFFYELDKRFSVVTPLLFEVWRKKPYQTEIFNILLNSLLSVYWHFRKAADEAETRVRKETKADVYKTGKITPEEYAERIRKARQDALSYELNADSIKERLTRDYDSKGVYRAYFWRDLAVAAEGLKEINLITGYDRVKGKRGQDKVVFHFSESYNLSESPTKLLPNTAPNDEEEIFPF